MDTTKEKKTVKTTVFIWTAPDGTSTPVTKMSDRHLSNSIKMIGRKLTETPTGNVSEKFWVRWGEMLPILLDEQRARKKAGIVIHPVS